MAAAAQRMIVMTKKMAFYKTILLKTSGVLAVGDIQRGIQSERTLGEVFKNTVILVRAAVKVEDVEDNQL